MIPNHEHWHAGPSGDMTLSVVSSTALQILKIDMLAQRTMQAGADGDHLARALNDLTMLAAIPELLRTETRDIDLPHPNAGHSPFPWDVAITPRRITVNDGHGRKIAERVFPKRMPAERKHELTAAITAGVTRLDELSCR